MRQSTIDRTVIEVSRLSFGTASLHHLLLGCDRRRMLDHAAAAGITHFDTSPYYGHGLAELALGGFLAGRRAMFTIATKVGLYPKGPSARTGLGVRVRRAVAKLVPSLGLPTEDWSVARARSSLEASLRRLRSDHVDFLFVHEPRLTIVGADALAEWLSRERQRGTVRAFGVAGVEGRIGELVRENHPLAQVVQTRDSLAGREANFVTQAGRPLQFTYGYLSRNRAAGDDPMGILHDALGRNESGSVIVSSRRAERISYLAGIGA